MAPSAPSRGTHCTRLPQTSGQLQGRKDGRIEREGDRQKGDVHVERGGKKNGQGRIERGRNRDDRQEKEREKKI